MNSTTFKSGFVTIVGRPNVGKSTFLNHVLKTKIAITSDKAQTTRNKIQGIYTTKEEQVIFIDTPGIHKPLHELGKMMNQMSLSSLHYVDLVLFMVDATQKAGAGDQFIIDEIKKADVPTILVLNKVDMCKDIKRLNEDIETYKALYPFVGGITISAKEDFNIDKLLEMVTNELPVGPMYYPHDQITDHPERFIVSELIREKVLQLTKEEVPHSVAVAIESFKVDEENSNRIDIMAVIIVDRPSQKKIIIGKGGSLIKEIGTLARKDIGLFLGAKVHLELWVKVEENWRNKKSHLKDLGYNLEEY
ncbi:MAG TPA: GTPase Era [Bacilli bacterium]|nr:GTPase Era [Bacilli bacterium]